MIAIAICKMNSVRYSVFLSMRLKPNIHRCTTKSSRKAVLITRAKIIHIRLHLRKALLFMIYSKKMNWLIDRMLNEMTLILYFEDIKIVIHFCLQSDCRCINRDDWSVKRLPPEPLDLDLFPSISSGTPVS